MGLLSAEQQERARELDWLFCQAVLREDRYGEWRYFDEIRRLLQLKSMMKYPAY